MTSHKNILTQLNDNDIAYCHWKSNEHLDRALDGKTDLDILVSKEDKNKLEGLLKVNCFIKVFTPAIKSVVDVEDFVGYDGNTGKLIHLHVHYVVVIGQKYVKNYVLPIESLFLTSQRKKLDVNVPEPSLELMILIIRMHIKLDWFDLVSYVKTKQIFPASIIKEFKELKQDYGQEKFSAYVNEIFSESTSKYFVGLLDEIAEGSYSIVKAFQNKYKILKLIKQYKQDAGLRFLLKKFYLSIRYFKYTQRFIKRAKKKTLEGNTMTIAFIGADGSGKSTVTFDIIKWLSWKLEVEGVYLGVPKTSVVLKTINFKRKVMTKVCKVFGKVSSKRVNDFFMQLQWLYVGYKRKQIAQQMLKRPTEGRINIVDRFPLSRFDIMEEPMDRPRIEKMVGHPNHLSKLENQFYDKIGEPDLMLVMNADIDTLRSRKTNLDLNKHIAKAEAVNNIVEGDGVAVIDATQPYDEVLLQVKTKIWEALSEEH